MFLLFAAACTAPPAAPVKTPDDEAPSPASELSLAGCSVEITTTTEGAYVETCTATFDHAGRYLDYDCLDRDGYLYESQAAYDDGGCEVYFRLYLTTAEFGYLSERDITCDANLHSLTEVGITEQYDATGAVEYTGDFSYFYTNTYDADLLVARQWEREGADPYLNTYEYDDADRLVREQGGPVKGRVTYDAQHFYDAEGNRVRTETESSYADSTHDREYDDYARVVRSEYWSGYDDETSVTLTEWEGDTLREVREQRDETNDGVFETVHDYVWTCP